MESTSPKINNLKVHLVLTALGTQHLKKVLVFKEKKSYNNFDVVREGYTYIIFPESGFINITGVKGFSELTLITPKFCQVFGLKPSDIATDVVVDNISASGNFRQRVNLTQLQAVVNAKRSTFSTHFDRNFFPGAFCKTRGLGTLTLFPSGRYVVVGSQCLEQVETIFQEMSAIIKMLSTTGKTSPFAPIAD